MFRARADRVPRRGANPRPLEAPPGPVSVRERGDLVPSPSWGSRTARRIRRAAVVFILRTPAPAVKDGPGPRPSASGPAAVGHREHGVPPRAAAALAPAGEPRNLPRQHREGDV